MIHVGVIGYGYWGPNLVRNFVETPGSEVIAVTDKRAERLEIVKKRYPTVKTTTDHSEVLQDPNINVIAIATPVSSHYALAMEALKAGKHVLCEKPLASTSKESAELIAEAKRQDRVLMVDHTFVYTGAVRKIHDMVASGDLGEIYYYDSVRVNLGLFQHDVNVLWDLAVHDLSIINYVLGKQPIAVSATGVSHVAGQPENIGYLTLFYEGSLIAHVHVNWMSPVKVRQTLIGGSKKMIVFDDLDPSEKIKVYDKGINLNADPESVYQMLISYRTGDMWAPQVDMTEALKTESLHFIRCIENGETPLTGGEAGHKVVQILEAATQSMHERGRTVELT